MTGKGPGRKPGALLLSLNSLDVVYAIAIVASISTSILVGV